ncbi:GNAT family N-acetyltransferase [Massilia solisilvae]|uniref:GNAT family N-acetyltransferase n=1 Tax=Massilia solisilvae TaxID=1811225 RepID=A0ABT2BQR4_9BURK|nr:GNAT family N-acetyltransferase [Massilia solisilvae]MCS0610853.1 GNAT family N-acetyltransferase [Massilia solisilvae]
MTRAYRSPGPADVSAILGVQRECYPAALREDRQTVEQRIAAARDFCWVAHDEQGLFAYLFAYPSTLGRVTPLGGLFHVQPGGDTLYLHDLAVSRRAARSGAGSNLVELAVASALARGFTHAALVAVQGSRPFWEQHGFVLHEAADTTQAANLQTYPGTAVYMRRQLRSNK